LWPVFLWPGADEKNVAFRIVRNADQSAAQPLPSANGQHTNTVRSADIVTVVFWLVSWPGTSVNRQ